MALTGNTVASTYLDLVQLEQSGAGLPSHAGKEAALYDGSGAQILGRTAQRNLFDPHPDAAAFDETWEFSTYGDATQGELETAGWTFDTGMTGSASGGILKLTSGGAYTRGARLTCNFTGDFDMVAMPVYIPENTSAESSLAANNFLGVGDADGTGHYVYISKHGTNFRTYRVHSATTTDWSGGTSANAACYFGWPPVYRICRTSGVVYITTGYPGTSLYGASATRVPSTNEGYFVVTSDADTATMDVISLGGVFTSGHAASVYWAFLRRFL